MSRPAVSLVARLLAVEVLLADPESLGDDVLEGCLYLMRERLRETNPGEAGPPQVDAG
jgi:hypothetical protein